MTMIMTTWTAMAALQSTHGHLNAFDMDLSEVPAASRQAVLIRTMGEYHQPGDPCQTFAATLGFAIDADGVATSDKDAAGRAYALAILLEDETYEEHAGPGPLAAAIGYGRAKQAQKDVSILADLAELVAATLGVIDDEMPDPSPAALQAMRIRMLAHRPALAA